MAIDFDVILAEVSEFGRYQIMVVCLLCVPACFMNAFAMSFIFAGYTPDFVCVPNHNDSTRSSTRFSKTSNETISSLQQACVYHSDTAPNDYSSSTSSVHHCTNFTYNRTYFASTVVTEWDLVCDKSIYPKIMMSVHSLVTLSGCLVNSYFQDIFGRKVAFLIVITMSLIGGISSAFAPNFLIYALLRALVAYTTTSTWNVSYTWALEYVGSSKRSLVTCIMCVIYGIAAVSVGGVAWLCDTWTKLTLVGSIPFLVLYSYAFIIDESPRWLLSQGRRTQALKTVAKIAKWQKRTLKLETVQKLLYGDEDRDEQQQQQQTRSADDNDGGINSIQEHILLQEQNDEKLRQATIDNGIGRCQENNGLVRSTNQQQPRHQQKPGMQDLFKTRNLRWKTCLLTYCWLANLLTYLAIAYNMENLKANIFVTYTLQAAMEIPSSLLIVFLLERYGRVPPLCVSMVSCGALLFTTVPASALGAGPWVVVGLALAAKFGISLSFGILVQLAGESYPTELRGLGIGFSSFVGTLGSTLMPYVVHSAKVYAMLPMILMGATAVTSGLSVLMLPDTKARYMPETVHETEVGATVGLAAVKENWRNMTLCRGKNISMVPQT